jgi:hypothetical protein
MRTYTDKQLGDWAQGLQTGQTVRVASKPNLNERDARDQLRRALGAEPDAADVAELVAGSDASGSYEIVRTTRTSITVEGGASFDRISRRLNGRGERGRFDHFAEIVPDDMNTGAHEQAAEHARNLYRVARLIEAGEALTEADITEAQAAIDSAQRA